jgi:hypothetical protein
MTLQEWDALPVEVEQAYRRGYVQGFLEAVRLIQDGHSPHELHDFGYGRLWRWRYARLLYPSCPPEPRRPRRRCGKRPSLRI